MVQPRMSPAKACWPVVSSGASPRDPREQGAAQLGRMHVACEGCCAPANTTQTYIPLPTPRVKARWGAWPDCGEAPQVSLQGCQRRPAGEMGPSLLPWRPLPLLPGETRCLSCSPWGKGRPCGGGQDSRPCRDRRTPPKVPG